MVKTNDVYLKPIVVFDGEMHVSAWEESLPLSRLAEPNETVVSITIHFEAAGPVWNWVDQMLTNDLTFYLQFVDLIRHLVQEAQKCLEEDMRVFMDRLGRVCETLNVIVGITDSLSDVSF